MSDTLLRMKLFVAVYEEGSFTAAAARENATQSGVTQHVRKLEDQHGVKLLIRGPTSVTSTPAGDTYYRGCIEVLRAHELSRQTVRSFAASMDGDVVVGLTPTMTRSALAPALAAFMNSHPNVVIRVVDAYGDIVIEKVRKGELDFAVVPGFRQQTGIRGQLFARTPEFLLSGRQSGLALQHLAPVKLSNLGALKMVLPSKLQVRRDAIENYLASVGAVVSRRFEIDSSLAAYNFVAHTDWVSVQPGIAVLREIEEGLLVVNPLYAPTFSLDLYRIERARQPLSAPAEAFLKVLHSETAKLQERAMGLLTSGQTKSQLMGQSEASINVLDSPHQ